MVLSENEEMDKYWSYYNSDCRLGGIFINSLYVPFQIISIIDPVENSNQRIVNIVYMIVSFINFTILALSFRKEYGIKFSYYAIVITLIRITFPVMDFENVD